MIEANQFRRDLYYRLGVIKVNVPALNERPDDIIPLAKYFMQMFSDKFGKKFSGITSEAENALLANNWTGNVRELKNLIEAAVLTGSGPELTTGDLSLQIQKKPAEPMGLDKVAGVKPFPPEGIDLSAELQSVEKFYIETALRHAGGNESKAARLLKMNHHTFRYRKKKLLAE
jgi:DNA-binding NtrC family response regulator